MCLISKPNPQYHLVLDQLLNPVNPFPSYLTIHSQDPTICNQGIRDLSPCLPEYMKGLLVGLFCQLDGGKVQGQVCGGQVRTSKVSTVKGDVPRREGNPSSSGLLYST